MPKLIILDLGNVLLNFDFNLFLDRIASSAMKPNAEVKHTLTEGLLKAKFERGQIKESEFFDQVQVLTAWQKSREELVQAWSDVFTENTGAKNAMKQLKTVAPLWILSDTNQSHARWFHERFPWTMDVDRRLFSFERGMLKSDHGAFVSVVKEAGTNPSEIVFYDDLSDNVERARASGIQAHLFTTWDSALKPYQK